MEYHTLVRNLGLNLVVEYEVYDEKGRLIHSGTKVVPNHTLRSYNEMSEWNVVQIRSYYETEGLVWIEKGGMNLWVYRPMKKKPIK